MTYDLACVYAQPAWLYSTSWHYHSWIFVGFLNSRFSALNRFKPKPTRLSNLWGIAWNFSIYSVFDSEILSISISGYGCALLVRINKRINRNRPRICMPMYISRWKGSSISYRKRAVSNDWIINGKCLLFIH